MLLTALLCATAGFASAQARPGLHTVSMEAVRFSPVAVELKVGDTVEWMNDDPFPHNATADNGAWASGDIGPGQAWRFRADRTGRFPYACTLHPGMQGVLVVK